jgi:transketolase C-terminal domain/subunit
MLYEQVKDNKIILVIDGENTKKLNHYKKNQRHSRKSQGSTNSKIVNNAAGLLLPAAWVLLLYMSSFVFYREYQIIDNNI